MDKSKEKAFFKGGFLTLGYIRDIVIILLLIVVSIKLLNSDIKINFQTFSFTDLLSVFLAFFAIALSAAFYFKATDTSNLFYDNTYKFTKEMSEILGRIEAGFGERLKHIDEGYSGLSDKIDKFPFDIKEAKEEKIKEENNIKKQEKDFNEIIINLMEKAHIADAEKDVLLKDLENHKNELDHSKQELNKLKDKINEAESDVFNPDKSIIRYLSRKIYKHISVSHYNAPLSVISKRFKETIKRGVFDGNDIFHMKDYGLLDENINLTDKGYKTVRAAIELNFNNS